MSTNKQISLEHQFAEKPLADIPVVVLDTETTGLYPWLAHRVVEVAAVRYEGWQEVDRFSQLIKPGRQLPERAKDVIGITDAELADQPTFAEIRPQLEDILADALIVAHNAEFDAAFLGMEMAIPYPSPETGIRRLTDLIDLDQSDLPLSNPWLCTLKLARKHFHFGRNTLTNIAHVLGVRVGKAHRALNDVLMTAEVLRRMAQKLEQEHRFRTVGDLLHAQGGAIYTPKQVAPRLPQLIGQALQRRHPVKILYLGKNGETNRVVLPRYAVHYQGNDYLIGYCQLREEQRSFRIDRIFSAELTPI